ncbi:MAG TPA: acyl-CoA dehydrogenase family protein [Acidimicrobiales bacterium]|nr:acyl-CoA dehydrogenase family protein [Acidimicrobiales bacterium]
MFDWSEEHQAISAVVRRFVDEEIRPHLDDLEHNGVPPYEILRKMYDAFGLKDMARENFQRQLQRKIAGDGPSREPRGGSDPAAQLITTIELCRVSPGLVTSLGVSTGLAAGTINKLGTPAQMERWGLDLMTLDKIGAWAITEPDSGSDALGGMRTSARRDGDEYILNGQKTWITNGPYADTLVVYAKLDDGSGADPRGRKVLTFVLDQGMEGLEQARPMRKMGQHGSPTGEVFLADVRVGRDRLLGESEEPQGGGRQSAKDNFVAERAGVAAMSLGVIEECVKLSIDYAKHRVLWGTPIGDFQLIQLKLAQMEVARINVRNMVFAHIERSAAGSIPTLAEASAMKLYAAQAACQVADDAIQIFGGNGYIAEYRVEQLSRDARVLRIYAGTDEMQVVAIAKDLIRS